MKTTNKILLALLGVLMVLLTAFKIGFNSRVEVVPKSIEAGFDIIKMHLEDFNDLRIDGRFDVTIKQADSNYVEVTGPDLLVNKYSLISSENGKLKISSRIDFGKYLQEVRVFITAKDLSKIKLSSGAVVTMNDWNTKNLDISTADTAMITIFGQLQNVNVKSIDNSLVIVDNAVDADLNLNGTSQVSMSMNGGVLKGTINDNVDFGFDGNIKANEVVDNRKTISVK